MYRNTNNLIKINLFFNDDYINFKVVLMLGPLLYLLFVKNVQEADIQGKYTVCVKKAQKPSHGHAKMLL